MIRISDGQRALACAQIGTNGRFYLEYEYVYIQLYLHFYYIIFLHLFFVFASHAAFPS